MEGKFRNPWGSCLAQRFERVLSDEESQCKSLRLCRSPRNDSELHLPPSREAGEKLRLQWIELSGQARVEVSNSTTKALNRLGLPLELEHRTKRALGASEGRVPSDRDVSRAFKIVEIHRNAFAHA